LIVKVNISPLHSRLSKTPEEYNPIRTLSQEKINKMLKFFLPLDFAILGPDIFAFMAILVR